MSTKSDPSAPQGPAGQPLSGSLQDPAGGLKRGDAPGQTPTPMVGDMAEAGASGAGGKKRYVVLSKGSVIDRSQPKGEFHEGDTIELSESVAAAFLANGSIKPA